MPRSSEHFESVHGYYFIQAREWTSETSNVPSEQSSLTESEGPREWNLGTLCRKCKFLERFACS